MGTSFSAKRTTRSMLVVGFAVVLIAAVTVGVVLAKSSTYENLKVFSEVLQLIQSNYVETVDTEKLVQGAIRGMLRTLDAHTSYMPPQMFHEMQVETEGSFGGLGIEITIRDDQLTVVSPIEGTPAYRAGIQADDRIVRVDGQPTKDLNLIEAVRRMRGPKGTKVTITILRKGLREPKDVTITRDIIPIRSVRSQMLEDDIGYVRVSNFQQTSSIELDKALDSLELKGMNSLVLDLRNNPGGLLNQAVGVTERFLSKGLVVVSTKGRKQNQDVVFRAGRETGVFDGPMVVLVNAGSASASEIVSGALQDHHRALVIGVPTFGKGSVQTILPLSNGAGLRLTTARYYTPLGKIIQEKGVTPDIAVEVAPLQAAAATPPTQPRRRRPRREIDLERHLKGDPVEPPADETDSPEKEPQGKLENGESEEAPATEKQDEPKTKSRRSWKIDLMKDVQLRRAVDVLKGWRIFKKTLSPSVTKAQAG